MGKGYEGIGVPDIPDVYSPDNDQHHNPNSSELLTGVTIKTTEIAIGVGTEVVADGIEKGAPASGLGQITTRLGATGTRVVGGAAAVVVGEVANSLITGGSGLLHRTAWAGAGDGVLFHDPDNTGEITEKRQYVFTEWDPTATNDMEALRAVFDSNGDGVLDAPPAALRAKAPPAGATPISMHISRQKMTC